MAYNRITRQELAQQAFERLCAAADKMNLEPEKSRYLSSYASAEGDRTERRADPTVQAAWERAQIKLKRNNVYSSASARLRSHWENIAVGMADPAGTTRMGNPRAEPMDPITVGDAMVGQKVDDILRGFSTPTVPAQPAEPLAPANTKSAGPVEIDESEPTLEADEDEPPLEAASFGKNITMRTYAKASAVNNRAHATLRNPAYRKAFDQYRTIAQTDEDQPMLAAWRTVETMLKAGGIDDYSVLLAIKQALYTSRFEVDKRPHVSLDEPLRIGPAPAVAPNEALAALALANARGDFVAPIDLPSDRRPQLDDFTQKDPLIEAVVEQYQRTENHASPVDATAMRNAIYHRLQRLGAGKMQAMEIMRDDLAVPNPTRNR